MNKRVCTIIVTFNRKELLLRCIEKCLAQTAVPDILIFDNHSSDGTRELLVDNGLFENERIIYHYNDINIGGAGGFSNGLKMAFQRGYDYYWVMDDDGYPYDERCLSESIKTFEELKTPKVIINALVVGPDLSKLSFKTGGFETKDELVSQANRSFYVGSISPFNGTLYSHSSIENIGFPREDFFIKGDETEYTRRAIQNGYIVATALNSIFVHPLMPQSFRRVLWKKIDLGEELYWKEYYKARNYVYIYRQYYPQTQLIKHVIYCTIKCLYYKEDRKRKIKYTLKGLHDGFKNNFEKIEI